jgi:hypothetical protein
MSSISYNVNIPNAPNNPSNDQPLMQENTNAIQTIWAVDHISFNSGAGLSSGHHTQVTFDTAVPTIPSLANGQFQIYPFTNNAGNSPYIETYASAKTNGGTQFNGYTPFVKAMAQVVSNGTAGVQTFTSGALLFNVASIVLGTGSLGAKTRMTVTFTTPLPYSTYYVFFGANTVGTIVTSTTGFTSDSGSYATIGSPFQFMVI